MKKKMILGILMTALFLSAAVKVPKENDGKTRPKFNDMGSGNSSSKAFTATYSGTFDKSANGFGWDANSNRKIQVNLDPVTGPMVGSIYRKLQDADVIANTGGSGTIGGMIGNWQEPTFRQNLSNNLYQQSIYQGDGASQIGLPGGRFPHSAAFINGYFFGLFNDYDTFYDTPAPVSQAMFTVANASYGWSLAFWSAPKRIEATEGGATPPGAWLGKGDVAYNPEDGYYHWTNSWDLDGLLDYSISKFAVIAGRSDTPMTPDSWEWTDYNDIYLNCGNGQGLFTAAGDFKIAYAKDIYGNGNGNGIIVSMYESYDNILTNDAGDTLEVYPWLGYMYTNNWGADWDSGDYKPNWHTRDEAGQDFIPADINKLYDWYGMLVTDTIAISDYVDSLWVDSLWVDSLYNEGTGLWVDSIFDDVDSVWINQWFVDSLWTGTDWVDSAWAHQWWNGTDWEYEVWVDSLWVGEKSFPLDMPNYAYNLDVIVTEENMVHCLVKLDFVGSTELPLWNGYYCYGGTMFQGYYDIIGEITETGVDWQSANYIANYMGVDDGEAEYMYTNNHDLSIGYAGSGVVYASWLDRPEKRWLRNPMADPGTNFIDDAFFVMSNDNGVTWNYEKSVAWTDSLDTTSGMPTYGLKYAYNATKGLTDAHDQGWTVASNAGWTVKDPPGGELTVYAACQYYDPANPVEEGATYAYYQQFLKVWKLKIDFVGIESEEVSIGKDFTLFQNYPNPFNPLTEIRFALQNDANVKLSIYNVKGELVSNLKNEKMVKGLHTVNFDANAFNSGVYFYKLNVNGRAETKKMVLAK